METLESIINGVLSKTPLELSLLGVLLALVVAGLIVWRVLPRNGHKYTMKEMANKLDEYQHDMADTQRQIFKLNLGFVTLDEGHKAVAESQREINKKLDVILDRLLPERRARVR